MRGQTPGNLEEVVAVVSNGAFATTSSEGVSEIVVKCSPESFSVQKMVVGASKVAVRIVEWFLQA